MTRNTSAVMDRPLGGSRVRASQIDRSKHSRMWKPKLRKESVTNEMSLSVCVCVYATLQHANGATR